MILFNERTACSDESRLIFIAGIVLSINGIGTMVILSLGKIVIEKLGEAHTVIMGLLLYCVRFLIFYFIQ